jgi:hypothetical protein
VSRANDNPTTPRWFKLSDLRRQHGWGEQRIRDVLKNADPEHWRCYQHEQRQRQLIGARSLQEVDCLEDKATFSVVGTEPSDSMLWSVHVEEVALLLPADTNGAPLADDAIAPPAVGPPPPPKVSVSTIVFDLAMRYPKGPDENMYGSDGWAQRMIRSDPRLANAAETTIANRWYEWNKLPKS